MSAEMVKLSMAAHRFERLEVDASVALKMFADNKFKTHQIPQMAAQSTSGKDSRKCSNSKFILTPGNQ